MLAGALFLAFNVAPTEEMILIAYKMTAWHSLALILVSIALLHILVFTVGFAGQEEAPEGYSSLRSLVIYTIPGYAIALAASAFVLWTFGSIDGLGVSTFDARCGRVGISGGNRRSNRPAGSLALAKREAAAETSVLEWVAAAIGLLLLMIVVAVVGRDLIAGTKPTPPTIRVEARRVVSTERGYLVEFEAINSGGATAAAVEIEGRLASNDGEQMAHASLDYVAGDGRASGGLYFTNDPRSGALTLRATGYQEP